MNKSLLLSLTVIILLSFTVPITTAQSSGTARDLLFVGIDPKTLNAGRNADIYLIRSDGNRVTNLTNTPLDSENHAYWSADGTKIYFSRNSVAVYPGSTEEQSSTSFYVMDISDVGKKTDERLLFHVSDAVSQPMRVEDWALSPDNSKLVFIPNNESLGGTYVAHIDGTNLHERIAKGVVQTIEPLQWSPDSTEFAYKRNDCTEPLTNLCPYWVTKPFDEGQPQMIGQPHDLMKRWHPNETVLTFDYPFTNVYRGDEQLFHNNIMSPALSPDGATLAFTMLGNEPNTMTVVAAPVKDIGNSKTLADLSRGTISIVEWSPDGKQLAFTHMPNGTNGYEVTVYVVNADGTGLKELLRRQVWLHSDNLQWRPDTQTKVG